MRPFLLAVFSFCLESCTTYVSLADQEGDEQLYFGIVRIQTPKLNDSVIAYKHSGLGVSVGHDFVLGWNDGKHVFVPITDSDFDGELSEAPCQIVIFVESKEDAVFTNQLLNQFEEGLVCSVNF